MLIANGSVKDPDQLRPLNRATTSTTYVDSATGSDANNGDVGTPLATLGEAVARVPEGYTGLYEIQCLGVGPYTLPSYHPRAAANSALSIYADRSAPVVSNAAPSFATVAGRTIQKVDPNFGAHPGFADGTHWFDWDISAFGLPVASLGVPCQASVSPSITTLAQASGQCDVYQYTTLLEIPVLYKGGAAVPLPGIDGGVNYYGFDISADSSLGSVVVLNLAFSGCLFSTGRIDFRGCTVGGYFSFLGQGLDFFDSEVGGMHLGPDGIISIRGNLGSDFFNSVTEALVILESGARIGFVNLVDFEAGPGLEGRPGSSVVLGGNGVSVYGTRLIRTSGTVRDAGSGSILGAVSGNLVELEDGGRMVGINPARWASVTAGGSQIVVGANPGTTMALAVGTNDLAAATPQGCFAS